MKILTILGARPQFVKAATVSRAIKAREDIEEVIVHTGQHFDPNMSDVFFEQLDIPRPNYNLQIAGLSHGAMTGRMLEGIESLILQEQPDWVMVYGDTNSTLAGALAATKLQIPVAHIEAGLRSRNSAMPEEINRVLTDRVSSLLLCPTKTAVNNLQLEGFPYPAISTDRGQAPQHIVNIGDVMYDAVLHYRESAKEKISLDTFGLIHKNFGLCTLHRQENTDSPKRLENILSALREIAKDIPLVMPLHPRTRHKIEQQQKSNALNGITVLDPMPYLEMQRLQMSAKLILTDSGGMQKEAYFHQVPCITMRDETEWIETLENNFNVLVGATKEEIIKAVNNTSKKINMPDQPFGNGKASEEIVKALEAC